VLSVKRIIRDYEDAGSVNGHPPLDHLLFS
jgi:hypothetical protein